ncbi:MAG: helix-hairpin-helix domain-containing protein [Bacteroidales bacterium]|nr:helix-hairpin-helix domain-containing protein [Bacteroidales bacterium]
MKNNNMSKPVVRSVYAFCIFVVLLFVGRHILSDQEQEKRIEQLEIQLAQLERVIDAKNVVKSEVASKVAAQSSSLVQQVSTPSKTSEKTMTAKVVDRVEDAVEKLTQERRSNKFGSPLFLELNVIDSATLVRVPGIAGRTASVILDYRERLGGFYSPEQLRERLTWEVAQSYMDDWCNKWFKADESLVQMLRINILSFREINRHPYISYEQTKALVNYREKHKRIQSMAELKQLGVFDEETLEKLSHYISFE